MTDTNINNPPRGLDTAANMTEDATTYSQHLSQTILSSWRLIVTMSRSASCGGGFRFPPPLLPGVTLHSRTLSIRSGRKQQRRCRSERARCLTSRVVLFSALLSTAALLFHIYTTRLTFGAPRHDCQHTGDRRLPSVSAFTSARKSNVPRRRV